MRQLTVSVLVKFSESLSQLFDLVEINFGVQQVPVLEIPRERIRRAPSEKAQAIAKDCSIVVNDVGSIGITGRGHTPTEHGA